MTLQSSGAISLANIATEFGGTAPHSLSEYYRGGAYVGAGAPNVPTSGGISFNQFYGASSAFTFNQTISVNTSDYNLYNAAIAAGWNGVLPLSATITVNAGVEVTSTSTGTPAFTVSGVPAGSSVTLTNNGTITGKGGKGGNGAVAPTYSLVAGQPGAPGGVALSAGSQIIVYNNGIISGGSGGGGGGYADSTGANQYSATVKGGNGGGGGGYGAPGTTLNSGGVAGGVLTGGAGGVGSRGVGSGSMMWANGGAGGSYASSGASSTNGGSLGGAAGACTAGNANITWAVVGTRYGALN